MGRAHRWGCGADGDARLPGLRERAGLPAGADGARDGGRRRAEAGARAARGPLRPPRGLPACMVDDVAGRQRQLTGVRPTKIMQAFSYVLGAFGAVLLPERLHDLAAAGVTPRAGLID